MNKLEIPTFVVALLILGVVAWGALHHTAMALGGVTNYDTLGATGLQIGVGCNDGAGTCLGTTMSSLITGTCTAAFNGTSLAATSTGQFLCSVTGVAAGDKVFVSLPAAARDGSAAWFDVVDTYATTTGRIGFDIANWTGVATTSFAQATTGIQYWVVR